MIILPSDPGPSDAEPFFIDYSSQLTPPLGGPIQQVNRLGSRFGISVTMPPLRDKEGRQWLQRLLRGKHEGVRMEFPLLGFDPGPAGEPTIVSQAGQVLNIANGQPGYAFRENQFVSLFHNGIPMLHTINTEAFVAVDGTAALSIFPLPRVIFTAGDLVEVKKPVIQGLISGNEQRWQMALTHDIGLSFEIREQV